MRLAGARITNPQNRGWDIFGRRITNPSERLAEKMKKERLAEIREKGTPNGNP